MAIRTVSNTGGLFSNPATWVGGIMPSQITQRDTIAFTATSGPLIVDSLYQIGGINYTNYTNTLTFNLNCTLFFDEQLVNTPFINMGTGGYTLIDNSVDGGYDFAGASTRPAILTNTLGIANPVRMLIYSSGLPMQITGTWNQTGILDSGGGIDVGTGTFTYTGTLYNGFDYSFGITAALGTTVNITTTDPVTDSLSIYGAGTINFNCIYLATSYLEGATLFNLNCGDVGTLDIEDGVLTSNITCANITVNLVVANTVNLLGTGTLPIPRLDFAGNAAVTPRIDNLNFGTYTFTDVYYRQYTNIGYGFLNLNLLSVLVCDKLYMRKSSTRTSQFSGAFGFICNQFLIDGDGLSTDGTIGPVTFQSGISYYINDVVDIRFPTTILSSTPGVKANIILGPNVNQNTISFLTATDIDCSGGRRINNFYGTATNCDNIIVWNDNTLPQATSTF